MERIATLSVMHRGQAGSEPGRKKGTRYATGPAIDQGPIYWDPNRTLAVRMLFGGHTHRSEEMPAGWSVRDLDRMFKMKQKSKVVHRAKHILRVQTDRRLCQQHAYMGLRCVTTCVHDHGRPPTPASCHRLAAVSATALSTAVNTKYRRRQIRFQRHTVKAARQRLKALEQSLARSSSHVAAAK